MPEYVLQDYLWLVVVRERCTLAHNEASRGIARPPLPIDWLHYRLHLRLWHRRASGVGGESVPFRRC